MRMTSDLYVRRQEGRGGGVGSRGCRLSKPSRSGHCKIAASLLTKVFGRRNIGAIASCTAQKLRLALAGREQESGLKKFEFIVIQEKACFLYSGKYNKHRTSVEYNKNITNLCSTILLGFVGLVNSYSLGICCPRLGVAGGQFLRV